jgi:hypothetical protein
MSALAKHYEEITERLSANEARIIYEYQHPQANVKRVASTESFTKQRRIADVPPIPSDDEWAAVSDFVRRANEKYKERLSREMVVLFKLKEQRTEMSAEYVISPVGCFTKGEAAELTGVSGGELLDLDNLYGAIIGRTGYLFISESREQHGIRKYGSDVTVAALIDDLIKERQVAKALGATVPG